jgi:hypothetical protein
MIEVLICTGILAILIGIVSLINIHMIRVSHNIIVAKLNYIAKKLIEIENR